MIKQKSQPISKQPFWSEAMRFGWYKPYEPRGSHTVLREAEVKIPCQLTVFKKNQIAINIKKC